MNGTEKNRNFIVYLLMIYRLLILLILFVVSSGNAMHPVHVSVTNIELNEKENKINVIIKIFPDDFEGIILTNYNVKLNLGKENEQKEADAYIYKYVIKNFLILINEDDFVSKRFEMEKRELSDGSLWLYFTYAIPKKVKSLQVTNTLLNDYYPDMTNLVIFKTDTNETGYSLNKTTTSFKIPA